MKLSEFEIAEREQWLRKLHEAVIMRRRTMYQFIVESVRMLILGNAGGIAMTMGIMGVSESVETYHPSIVATLLCFVLGVVFSATTLGLVTAVAVKEAHGAEVALDNFVRDAMERDEVIFFNDAGARRFASAATGCGLFSMALLALGAIIGLINIIILL